MAKEITSTFKLVVPAGKATPAPPLGPILGQNGININDFCTEFNEKTRDQMGDDLPVIVTVYKDRTFRLTIKKPTVAGMLKKAVKAQKGSATPNLQKIGSVNEAQVEEIAKIKLVDLNTKKLESAKNIVKGTAKSLGIEVK